VRSQTDSATAADVQSCIAGLWSELANDARPEAGASLEWVAARAFESVARDASLAGSLDPPGYLPLLEWIADRTLVAAACLPPETDADTATAMLAAILQRLLQAAVWAAETSDVTLLQRQVAACPPLLVHTNQATAALAKLVLDADANGNALTIAATLRAATPGPAFSSAHA
jgi:hypothetical protein